MTMYIDTTGFPSCLMTSSKSFSVLYLQYCFCWSLYLLPFPQLRFYISVWLLPLLLCFLKLFLLWKTLWNCFLKWFFWSPPVGTLPQTSFCLILLGGIYHHWCPSLQLSPPLSSVMRLSSPILSSSSLLPSWIFYLLYPPDITFPIMKLFYYPRPRHKI